MPAPYSLAQHGALQEVQAQLLDSEAVFAYLDDIYVVAAPELIRELYDAVARVLWGRARVQLNCGKTRVWNAAAEEPARIEGLGWGLGAPTAPARPHGSGNAVGRGRVCPAPTPPQA